MAVLAGRGRGIYLAQRIGTALRECRTGLGMTQAQAAARAGLSQPFWSRLERGAVATVSIETVACCAAAVGAELAAFLQAAPGADLPRDIEHLRRQQLVVALARDGGWTARPERPIDPDARRSRSVDVELERALRREIAVVEIVDLLADGGDAMRGLADKVAAARRGALPGWSVAGLLILRRTSRNRGTFASSRTCSARGSQRRPPPGWLPCGTRGDRCRTATACCGRVWMAAA